MDRPEYRFDKPDKPVVSRKPYTRTDIDVWRHAHREALDAVSGKGCRTATEAMGVSKDTVTLVYDLTTWAYDRLDGLLDDKHHVNQVRSQLSLGIAMVSLVGEVSQIYDYTLRMVNQFVETSDVTRADVERWIASKKKHLDDHWDTICDTDHVLRSIDLHGESITRLECDILAWAYDYARERHACDECLRSLGTSMAFELHATKALAQGNIAQMYDTAIRCATTFLLNSEHEGCSA